METPNQGTNPQPAPEGQPAVPEWTPPAPPAVPPTSPAPVLPAPAAPGAQSPASRPTPRWLNIALMGALVVAVAGLSFAAGRATAPSALDELRANAPGGGQFFGPGGNGPNQGNPNFPGGQGFPGQGGQGGQGPQGGRFFGAGGGIAIEGTVESIDADSVTVKTASGQSIEVAISGDTDYHTAQDATATAVTTGSQVVVRVEVGGGQNGGQGGGFSFDAADVTVVQ